MGSNCVTCSKNKNKHSSLTQSPKSEETKVERKETLSNDLRLAIAEDGIS